MSLAKCIIFLGCIAQLALGSIGQHCNCNVSTLKILKGINDYTPAVVLGANFSMKLNFSVDCTGAPVISWKQTTGGTNIQIAATMLGDSVYMAELAITNTNRSTYGTYRVSFCNTLLNVFTVFSLREECDTTTLPPVPENITMPLVVPNWNDGSFRSVNFSCMYYGITDPSKYLPSWNYTQPSHVPKPLSIDSYDMRLVDKCHFLSSAAASKPGRYTCFAMSYSRRFNKSISTQLTFIDFPEVQNNHQLVSAVSSTAVVTLNWIVTGYDNYTIPQVIVNSTLPLSKLTNSSNLTIQRSEVGFAQYTVSLILSHLPLGKHQIQLFVLLNNKTVSNIRSYNDKPNASAPTTITVDTNQVEPWKIAVYAVAGVVVFIGIKMLAIVTVIFFIKKRPAISGKGFNKLKEDLSEVSVPVPRIVYGDVVLIYHLGNGEDKLFYDDIVRLADILSSTRGDRTFRFDGYCRGDVGVHWDNKVAEWIKNAEIVLLVLTPELSHRLTASDTPAPISMVCGSVGSRVISNFASDIIPGSRTFIPIFLNMRIDKKLIPASLISNEHYEIDLKTIPVDINTTDKLQHYINENQAKTCGLINLLRRLNGDV